MVKIDMEMPTYCYDCPCNNGENGRCNITCNSTFDKRPFDCPLKDDVAPVVHAKIKNWRCTNCNIGLPVTKVENHNGIVWQYVGEMKYCPNCGAKFDENL